MAKCQQLWLMITTKECPSLFHFGFYQCLGAFEIVLEVRNKSAQLVQPTLCSIWANLLHLWLEIVKLSVQIIQPSEENWR